MKSIHFINFIPVDDSITMSKFVAEITPKIEVLDAAIEGKNAALAAILMKESVSPILDKMARHCEIAFFSDSGDLSVIRKTMQLSDELSKQRMFDRLRDIAEMN